MKAIDLTKTLQGYKQGWVAINNKYKVIAHAETYKEIVEKVFGLEEKIILLPATGDYSRYIT
ncbi:hypothetical protein A2W14_00990 [Candidatus Gottesmanbacteria bacterium RBG_16_37_8]|uniref:Uncharacterized protein n=1 Tax=Candidatus Gottesmanbacteria bacterium RBG_16_37_8 TaxID=1798371 RepID=A0A1F5YQ06_9BACT|nr:MAG: hypothetical protein A2W14_00990 [Candidatus Gottesmanbacteria bacterium RBG_16_37_8]